MKLNIQLFGGRGASSSSSYSTSELYKMNRKQLTTLIVEDQIRRGVVKKENKDYIIKRQMTDNLGSYQSKTDLVNYVSKYIKKNKK